MIAVANGSCFKPTIESLQRQFLQIRPRIELHAHLYFRNVKCGQAKDDCIAETLAIAWKWFIRLVEKGKDPMQFPSVLASYAARAVRSGRRLCGQLRAKDVLSEVAQKRH